LVTLLLGAIAYDIKWRRIPNGLVLAGLLLGLLLHFIQLFLSERSLAGGSWWSPVLGCVVGFTLFMPLHVLRAMGAGDVKLMAMVGTFVGTKSVVVAVLYTLVAGGLLSLVFMLIYGVAVQTISNLRVILRDLAQRASGRQTIRHEPLQVTAARLPYAVAIGIGTMAALLSPPPFTT
jgi:prepilin peptidase CpaA